jgi:amphi-Trp domain-containing protein
MPRSRDRDIEKVYSTKQFVAKLRRLADALETGKPFTIQVAGESIRVPDDAVFNIEHERDGSAEEVEFQLRWRRGDTERPHAGRQTVRARKVR